MTSPSLRLRYRHRASSGSVQIHEGGEDALMLGPQAESVAAAGFRVVAYDRRGTARSGRDDWPGEGAQQHADDAAALIHQLGLGRTTVVGVSSGGDAEAMIRDEPKIPVYRLRRNDLVGVKVTVVVGSHPIGPIKLAAKKISSWTGTKVVQVEADHEVYLTEPTILTGTVRRGER